VAFGQDDMEVVDEEAAAPHSGGFGYCHARHVVDDRDVRLAAAQALDRLARLELEHLDDKILAGPTDVADGRWYERRERAGEGGQPQARRAAA
jgi:hypothetical protein